MHMPDQTLENVEDQSVSKDAIRIMMTQAVNNVFSTMLDKEATYVDPESVQQSKASSCPLSYFKEDCSIVVGMVGFLGNVSGVVYLYLEEALARHLVGTMLGMSDAEMTAEGAGTINDGLGEICNMTVGSFKQQLCATGYECRLTIPSIISGSHFSIETSADVTRCSFPFKTDDALFVVDVLLKVEDN